MKKIINCKICLEDKDKNITLEHVNSTGDVSEHQMCEDCYNSMTKNECPFCRCKIILPKPKLNATELSDLDLTPEQLRTRERIRNVVFDRTRSYDLNRIAAGLNGLDGRPLMFSN